VTGAARGIGAATARRLARDGYRVAVLDLSGQDAETTAAAIREAGGESVAVGADVSDEDAVTAAVAQVADTLGPPTVLVNNAGILRDNLLFRMSATDFDDVVRVHLRGAFLVSRAVQAYQVEARWGRVVNLSSTSALGHRGQANYAAAKAGIQGFTRTLAIELGPFGVTVNAVAPGFVETEMTRAVAERLGVPFAELVESEAKAVPVRRVGRPEDVAAAVSFFASQEAGFVSGQVLYVAGGPRA
jgi:3-oxoacyl-[acyl-carrier protein] reductase